jgi:hypothetical protein
VSPDDLRRLILVALSAPLTMAAVDVMTLRSQHSVVTGICSGDPEQSRFLHDDLGRWVLRPDVPIGGASMRKLMLPWLCCSVACGLRRNDQPCQQEPLPATSPTPPALRQYRACGSRLTAEFAT